MEHNFQSKEYLDLNCAGVTHINWKSRTLRENGRLDYQIIYIYEGCICAEIDGVERRIPEGNVILYRPHEKQKYAFLADHPTVHSWIHFSGTGCDAILEQVGFRDTHVLHIGKNKQLVDMIQKLETEFRLQKEEYRLLCRGYLLEFFALLMRTRRYRDDPAALKNALLIEDVCTAIHQELEISRPLAFYAAYCNLSLSRFAHIFKEATGISPREYINNARLEKAAHLLTSTYLTIAEIAQRAGYRDQNYFTKAFKQKTGLTPKQYRTSGRHADA